MNIIGYWIRNLFDEDYIHPGEVSNRLDSDIAEQICTYLDNGVIFEKYRGHSWCRFSCGIDGINMGSCELTDGTWIWPEGLRHYVEVHHTLLPDQFIESALGKSVSLKVPLQPNDTFWRNWCDENRDIYYVNRLKEARDVSLSAIEKEIANRIKELQAETGESASKCLWAECSEQALRGKSICALHALGETERQMIQERYNNIPIIK